MMHLFEIIIDYVVLILGYLIYFLGYFYVISWVQNLSYLESKSTYYTIYFIFLNYLHICTTIIISYESSCYKCADSMQMKTDYKTVLSGLCILINKISKTIKTFFVLEHCIKKIKYSHKALILSWIRMSSRYEYLRYLYRIPS